ncbi:MAG: circadian clock KaiB family protein [Bacteroidales bacterium]|nr:circadian clock KaiB family protein [Bacteroidales bacterium]
MSNKYVLELYITSNSSRSEQAITNLRKMCEENLGGDFSLTVIDVLDSPEEAEKAKILATPTLIKKIPPPVKRLIGDFSDSEKILGYINK